jgi:hypothetical protein
LSTTKKSGKKTISGQTLVENSTPETLVNLFPPKVNTSALSAEQCRKAPPLPGL